MMNSTPTQLRFAPSAGFTLRADFNGGGLSSDLGPLLLRGVDRQIGLTQRLATALVDRRHPGYVKHTLHDVLTQRIFQIASGYPQTIPSSICSGSLPNACIGPLLCASILPEHVTSGLP